ncbi:hypothetical protein CAPTEDRAFT_102327 [Capitella teleta]|uniref:Uncharacterized protein n=1 Tax=Capitella teleta TaxID=283909 RepID=R7T9U7_CAPTE|nr:hypothetical protein CAPTEDRAFT_102327 [Capitella teleta]|eukprot:ELT88135.1 hypothetical protein CAPTEDRAFT_102327 [Capitella teleta]
MATSAFSPSGDRYVFSSPDGNLKLFNALTGSLEQEYTPSSHLSATCSCLSWCPQSKLDKKPKRRKSEVGKAVHSLELVAIGTTSGSLLLYSINKGSLHSELNGGHTDQVHCVCWSSEGQRLFSSSEDQHIIEWSLETASVKHKWKGDKTPVTSVLVCPNDRHLLSAGRSIKLWDLETREMLKKFTGHSSEVISLFAVSPACNVENGAATNGHCSDIDGSYFLSAAKGDRMINAWQINLASKDKNSLASFSLPEEPCAMHLSQPQQAKPFLMSVVTRSGQLLVFEYTLNGRAKKPLTPKISIQVATEDAVPAPIPILAAAVLSDGSQAIMIAHGSALKPTLEKIEYSEMTQDLCLIRKDPSKSAVRGQQSVSKVKVPETSSEVTVLGPGSSSIHTVQAARDKKPKRKRKASVDVSMSMEERLNAISLEPDQDKTAPPKADSLAVLLTQGLHSQDRSMISSVLQNSNSSVIKRTVHRLPIAVIVPLVKELSRRMEGPSARGPLLLKWVKTVLTMHTSYLMTFPELVDGLSSLYQLIESRVSTYGRLSRLQGKLNLLLAQVCKALYV